MEQNFYYVALFFMFSNLVGTIAGFGSVVIGLSLAAHFYPIQNLVPIVVPIDIFSSVFIFYKYRSKVNWKIFSKTILPQVGIGFLVGMIVSTKIQGDWMKRVFGAFIFIFAAVQLYRFIVKKAQNKEFKIKAPWFLIPAGIIQGIYASGGPVVVTYLSTKIHNKDEFRSTLATLWCLVNTIMIANFMRTGLINSDTMNLSIVLVPFVITGIIVGEWLQKKVSAQAFKILVYALLCFAGFSLLF